MKKQIVLVISFLLVFITSGCQSEWKQPIPEGEIVFQVAGSGSHALGFVQADGENAQVIEIGKEFASPDWSPDGVILYGLTEGKGSTVGWPAYWNVNDGRFRNCNAGYANQIVSAGDPAHPESALIALSREIVLIDIDRCKKIETLVDVGDQIFLEVDSISYLPDSPYLIYSIAKYNYDSNDIGIRVPKMEFFIFRLDMSTGEKNQIANGVEASLSPDHSRIAYVGIDGLYIMPVDGTNPRRLFARRFLNTNGSAPGEITPLPRWSPDGNWLVFHLCEDEVCAIDTTPIYKLSVETGEMIKLTTGGWYPSWRP